MPVQFESPPDPSADALLAEQVNAAHDHLASLIKLLGKLRKRDAELAERQWALSLREGAVQAQARVIALREAMPVDSPGDAIGDLLALAQYLREQVWSVATCEDIGAERGEAGERPGAALVTEVEQHADHGQQLVDRIGQLAIDLTQAFPERTTPMSKTAPAQASVGAGTATAADPIRPEFLYDMLSTLSAGRAAAAAPNPREAAVGARLRQTLDSLGLPHDGSALGHAGREREARELLVDSLRRNFASRDQEGVRSYYRVDRLAPVPTPRDTASTLPGLRGLGLCQAETLRFRAELVLRLIDELPQMLPYQLRLTTFNAEQLRDRIKATLDELVTLMAAPLGPTEQQAQGRFRRLLLTVADWLEGGQVLHKTGLRHAAAADDPLAELRRIRPRLRRDEALSPVAGQEIATRVEALFEVLEQIGDVVFDADARDTGRDAAQIEQMLTLLGASAGALQAELATLGTSPDEQEVAYFGGAGHETSVGQFARWASDLSASFASGDDLAATLRRDELRVLALELDGLADMASALDRETTGPALLRLVGARRQVKELATLIDDARERVRQLIDDTGDAASAA